MTDNVPAHTAYLHGVFLLGVQITLFGILAIFGFLLHESGQKSEFTENESSAMTCATSIPATNGLGNLRLYHGFIDDTNDPVKGKRLWNENICGSCHNKNMKSVATGPALGGVTQRWKEHPKTDLYDFIRHSQLTIESGQPRALEVWEKFAPTVMPAFSHLTDQDINNLLAYVESTYGGQ